MSKTQLVRAMPTQPDVDRLMDAFGVPDEGARIAWEEIETVLQMRRRGNHRWGTVLAAWRRQLEDEHGVWLRTISGCGLEACDPMARVHQSTRWIKSGGRSIMRASALSAKTDRGRLDAHHQKLLDCQRLAAGALNYGRWIDSATKADVAALSPHKPKLRNASMEAENGKD